MYSEEEQRLYNKISRILVQHFLTRDYESIILTSKRVHSNKRQDHIMTKRKLLEQFAEMFSAWGLLLYYNMISTVSFPKIFSLEIYALLKQIGKIIVHLGYFSHFYLGLIFWRTIFCHFPTFTHLNQTNQVLRLVFWWKKAIKLDKQIIISCAFFRS